MNARPRLVCFGLGYCAERLARRLAGRGFEIAGTTRDPASRRATVDPSWALFQFDGRSPLADAEQRLAGTTHILHSIMPDESPGGFGDPVLRHHAALIDALPELVWIGYLSTTGVYGDHAGAWVTEASERRPSKPRTERRVAAEDAWLARGAQVFRLAGIYGPGRSAIDRVRAGDTQRILAPGKLFNRIHVDDVATVLEASIDRNAGVGAGVGVGRAYNVADGHPASSAAVIEHAATLLGVELGPAVPLEHANLSAMARSFWADNVRVSNDRIVTELGVELAYPDYRAGLDAIARIR